MKWHRSHDPPKPVPVPTTPPPKPPDSKPSLWTDNQAKNPYQEYVAADKHDNVLVSLVDPYPDGRLQAQLDRIEAKLDDLIGGST